MRPMNITCIKHDTQSWTGRPRGQPRGVRLGGSPGYPEAPGNVVAGEAFGNQLADLRLPAGEPVRLGTAGRGRGHDQGRVRLVRRGDLDDVGFRHGLAGVPQLGEPGAAEAVTGGVDCTLK